MNLTKLGVQEMNTQEVMSIDGGFPAKRCNWNLGSFWRGVGDGLSSAWNDLFEGFNDGSGANCE